jgi:hypothetical protein
MIRNLFCKLVSSRFFQFVVIPLFVLLWFLGTDPSEGADTLLRLQLWAQAFLITGFSYLASKALLGKAKSEELYEQVLKGNSAAGVAYAGVAVLRALVLVGLLLFFGAVQ